MTSLWHKARSAERTCVVCAGPFFKPISRAHLFTTCSPKCREVERAGKRCEKPCRGCGKTMVVLASESWRANYCAAECRAAEKERRDHQRTRVCVECGRSFVARPWQIRVGIGTHCSRRCVVTTMVRNAHTAEANRKRAGERWRGGLATLPQRQREHRDNRRAAKKGAPGRIAKGRVEQLLRLQRGRCPVCKKKFGRTYHLDHIYPLSRGGEHHALNIQLLCASCNLSKGANDPLVFMRRRGFLL